MAGKSVDKQVTIAERRLAAVREAFVTGQTALAAAADRVEVTGNTLGKAREDAAATQASNELAKYTAA